MMPDSLPRRVLYLLVGAMAIALIAWAAVTVIGVEPFDNQGYRNAAISVLTAVLIGVGAALVLVLRRGEAGRAAAEREAEAAREDAAREGQRAAEAEARADDLKKETERRRREADDQRHGAVRALAALERERHWSQELRRQVMTLHQTRSALAPREDLRSLVLRVALDLTDAPKGLLLGRDPGSDGPLEVVAAEGFEEDARRSEIAQRFAERAMERDAVIREDAPRPPTPPSTRRSPA